MSQEPIYAQAHEAVDMMAQRKIPPSPAHYEVWHAYMSGSRPDVAAAVKDIIAKGDAIDASTSEALHERFFSGAHYNSEVLATGNRIAQEMASVIVALQEAASGARDYNEVLAQAQTDLNAIGASEPTATILRGLMDATRSFAERNTQLQANLNQTTREIDQLRTSLERVRLEAFTDALTGVANRKFFDETMRLRIAEAHVENTPMCLAMCDIDHFKKFNDTWGHQTGDQVIKFTAAALQRFAKPDFLVARYGGEEFAMIMPRTEIWEAFNILEQARVAIESKKLVRRSTKEDLGVITASFGIAVLEPGEKSSSLIERADKCLYASKRGGRNRVTPDRPLRGRTAA